MGDAGRAAPRSLRLRGLSLLLFTLPSGRPQAAAHAGTHHPLHVRGGRREGRPGAPPPTGATGENDIAEVRRERAAPSPAGTGGGGPGRGRLPPRRAGPGPLSTRSWVAAGPSLFAAAALHGQGLPRPVAAAQGAASSRVPAPLPARSWGGMCSLLAL